jgi:hypothetical protein
VIEKKLKYQQLEVTSHKNYFLAMINDNRITLIATLLPGFLWGWKQARVRGKSKIMKQLIRYGLLAVATNVKKHIVAK